MEIDLDEPSLHQQQLCLLQTWLKRSKDCPLSITLGSHQSTYDPEDTREFLEAIVRHSARWADMTLVLPYENLHLIVGDMPCLRRVIFGPDNDMLPSAVPLVVFDRAPKLRHVILSTCFIPFAIILPWSQITTLEACLYDSEALEVLRHTAKLECLSLALPIRNELTECTMVLQLLHLTFLSIRPHPEFQLCYAANHLFDSLTMPALQILQLDERVLGIEPTESMSSFVSFMSRIRSLKELRITYSDMPRGFYESKFQASVSNIHVESASVHSDNAF
ncbi:hypothetical protein C8R44DRAFT_882069 [Mycena epipterygia]|nr:hypothetical protein C8R44DRAFT_882069 [Mycena epipterygia]